MQETRLRESPEDAGDRRRPGILSADSPAWLILVSALFLLSELLPALLRLPLGADEITYIARTSARSSGVFLPPVHGQGAGLLAAPVTLLTTSLTAIRIWMAVLSALALLGSLWCWRSLRPAWVLALAGFIFGSLAITQLSGVQIYPDLWAGFGALAITGLLLQAVERRARRTVVLPLIAFAALVIVLMRPQNLVFVLAPTFVAPLVVRGWRKPGVLVAMIVGAVLGVAEWVVGAYLWFGGLSNRISWAGQEPPSFGLHFSLSMQIRTMSGPWYSEPRACTSAQIASGCKTLPGVSEPAVLLWWLAFFGLVALGLYASWRRPSRASSVLAVVTGGWSALLYILLVPFGAPRYFLATWALFAIVAADGIGWLVTVPRWKTACVPLAGAFLVSWAISQHVVLVTETAQATSVRPFEQKADAIKRLGLRPPCAVGSPSVAYFLGCTGPWTGGHVSEIFSLTPGGPSAWKKISLPPGAPYRFAWVRR
ncbi:MAG TPA: hypothetical protein VEL03_14340 [Streptosporangiaceae bacterium]|nr:hypothetical protein [Streptosporangiaceae bacterium]